MKKGDVIINPYVRKLYNGKPNPCYATIYTGKAKNGNLKFVDFNGCRGEWAMPSDREFRVIGHVNIDLFTVISKFVDWSTEEGEV